MRSPSGKAGQSFSLRSPSQEKGEVDGSNGNAQPHSSSIHGSAAILRLALNIHDSGGGSSLKTRTKTSSGLSTAGQNGHVSMMKSPSMPRVGFSQQQLDFADEDEPCPFPQLSGSQVPGYVPSPTTSLGKQASTRDQSMSKHNAMAAAAVTAVSSHNSHMLVATSHAWLSAGCGYHSCCHLSPTIRRS
jgi:hypothetical protein